MASKTGSVWAIDIGNNSLKALHLSTEGGVLQVIGFDNIRHGKVLTGNGVQATERDELVALSLQQFVNRNDLGEDDIVVSVPSQNSFARFVNLPPVEQKRIPELVKFEAVQQIPFDIDDVQWDWQVMAENGSGENKVGIFAIQNDVVNAELQHFSRENLQVRYVQMTPMALFNYVLYDRPELCNARNQAVVVINIGAENTDLVVCKSSAVWQRCILIGGNAFTRAIAESFRLGFEKAEKLKRNARMSKYARQIFQAMKPVFTDLASEIQRSLGFYNSSNPDTKLTKIIALGGGTKLHGLLTYLQQTLRIPTERPDSFKKLAISSDVSAVKFDENVCDFGVVYGLGLQGLGLARVESNLLPRGIARSMAWAGKAKYFIAAASLLLVVSVLSFGRTLFDKAKYNDKADVRRKISSVIEEAKQADDKLKAVKSEGPHSKAKIQKAFDLFKYRDVIPLLHQTIISALPNEKNNPEQKQLYEAFAKADIEEVLKVPRKQRKQIFITSMSVYFAEDLQTAQFGSTDFTTRRSGATEGYRGEYDESRTRREYDMYEEDRARQRRFGMGTEVDTEKPEQVEKKTGFVVSLTGYSPYEKLGELMDPAGVENVPERWGFVTRLLHLDDIVDGNSPFELYKKTEVEHFKLEIGEVSLDAPMPMGVGIQEAGSEGAKKTEPDQYVEPFLIDPMTQETISKVRVLDEHGKPKLNHAGEPIYEVNDHWFVLNAKFIWKDAPSPPEQAPVPTMSPYDARRTRRMGAAPTSASEQRKRTEVKFEDF